jgi:hypothetical protein
LALYYYYFLGPVLSALFGGTTAQVGGISSALTIAVSASGFVILVTEILGYVQLRSAFMTLATFDPGNFKATAKSVKTLLVALPLAVLGIVLELFTFGFPLLVLASAGISVVAGLVAFISYIVGPVLGLWRVG